MRDNGPDADPSLRNAGCLSLRNVYHGRVRQLTLKFSGLAILAVALLIPSGTVAEEAPATNPIVRASREHEVDLLLLLAIAHSESGFHAFALNIAGRPYFPATRREALALLRRSSDRVDIGLFQINFGIWGERLDAGKADLLDPALNSDAAAKILKGCLKMHGLRGGVSCYHAGTPGGDTEYADRVLRAYQTYQERRSEIRLAPGTVRPGGESLRKK